MAPFVALLLLSFLFGSVLPYTKKTSRAETQETEVVTWLTTKVGPRSKYSPPDHLDSICANVKVASLDYEKGALVAGIILELIWEDERLAFGVGMNRTRDEVAEDAINVERVILNSEDVWTPDMVFFSSNHLGNQMLLIDQGLSSPLEVNRYGEIVWRQFRTEQFRCLGQANRTKGFWDPFDCSLELASWTQTKKEVVVEILLEGYDEDMFPDSWQSNSVGVSDWSPQCCLTGVKNAYGNHDCVRCNFVAQRRYKIDQNNWHVVWNPTRDFGTEGSAAKGSSIGCFPIVLGMLLQYLVS